MLIQVDKSENFLVQKITDHARTMVIRYQTVPVDKLGDSTEVQCFDTLQEARESIGLAQPPVVADSKPSAKVRKVAKAEKASATSAAAKAKKSKTKKAA